MEVAIVGVYNLSRLSAFGGITAVPGRSSAAFIKETEVMPSYVRHASVDKHKRCRLIARFFCRKDGTIVASGNKGKESNRPSSLPAFLIIPLGRDPLGGNSGVIAYKVAAQGSLLSRRHCVLQLSSSNALHIPHTSHEWCALTVRDCGSLNGTFVNGRRLASGAVSTPVIFDPCDINAGNEPLLTLELGAGAKLIAGDSLSSSQVQLRFHVFVRCLFVREEAGWIQRRLEGSCVNMASEYVTSVCTKDIHWDVKRDERLRKDENSLEQGLVLKNELDSTSNRNNSDIMSSVYPREVSSNDSQHSIRKEYNNDKKSEISPFSISLIYGSESGKKENQTLTSPPRGFTNTHVTPDPLTTSNDSKHIEEEKEEEEKEKSHVIIKNKDPVVVVPESDMGNNTHELMPRVNIEKPEGNLSISNYSVSEKIPIQEQQDNPIEETVLNLSPVLVKKKKVLTESPDMHDSLSNRYTRGNLAPSAVMVSEFSAGETLPPHNLQSLVDFKAMGNNIVPLQGVKNISEAIEKKASTAQEYLPHNNCRPESESLSLPTSQDDRVIALPRHCVVKQEMSPEDENCVTVNNSPPSVDSQVSNVAAVSNMIPSLRTPTKCLKKRKRANDVKETLKCFMTEICEVPTKSFSSKPSKAAAVEVVVSAAAAAVLRSGLELGSLAVCNSERLSLINTSGEVNVKGDHLLRRENLSSVGDSENCITTNSTNSQVVVHESKSTDAELEGKKNVSSTSILNKQPNNIVVSHPVSCNNAKKVSRLKVAEKRRNRLACVLSAIDRYGDNLEYKNEKEDK
ncbi:putative helicase ARIP4 isoform X3 [Trypanosoma theileri]|uniref:Putative helicase ARIP4 isoform X3 n=1 Tax=Trypanosoma theileri TaxID=67003 RepID=A0A1X0NVL4_9TRYP|nr:putative helicase ARIP4 isoform X3 [Trypanosoma theileri]ORC88533.1 putative helicase ARIP4 isoform X3 [Trypanosoma theileri]